MADQTCPNCGAPCTTEVMMRGGDHGWSTTDKERTVYRFAAPQAPSVQDSDATPFPMNVYLRNEDELREFVKKHSGQQAEPIAWEAGGVVYAANAVSVSAEIIADLKADPAENWRPLAYLAGHQSERPAVKEKP